MRVWSLLILALLLSILIGAAAGHDWVTPADLLRALAGDTDLRSRLLIDWRLPRVLAAACRRRLAGPGRHGLPGRVPQSLAEPYLLGSAGGAALGATVALLVPLAAPQSFVLPVLAFAGAWGATMLVIGISRVAGAVDAAGMLLAGVAVAAVLGALRSFLMLALSDETVSLQIVLSWVLGGVQTPTWPILGLLAADHGGLPRRSPCCWPAGSTCWAWARPWPSPSASTSIASSRSPCWQARSSSPPPSPSAGWSPSSASPRRTSRAGWSGRCIGRLLPASALVGAIVVTLADAIARSALPPAEIPLGLVTAVAGGPFFILLLARRLRT